MPIYLIRYTKVFLGVLINFPNWLGAYGAFLSTAVFIWNILKSRPRIHVKIVHDTPNGIVVSIQNPSNNTVHITSVSFLHSTGSTPFKAYIKHILRFRRVPSTLGWCFDSLSSNGVNVDCPKSIESGKSHLIHISEDSVRKLLNKSSSKEFKIAVQDALWKNTYSSKFRYEF